MTMRRLRVLPQTVIALVMVAGIGACALPDAGSGQEGDVTGLSGSRSTLYSGLEDLAADSALVVLGTVVGQREVTETIDYTISTFEIARNFVPEGLAAAVDGGVVDVESAGTTLEVRQLGAASYAETPAPLLAMGNEYLLYLTPSGLPGEAASQFYVTGGEAGLFEPVGDNEFRRLTPESGDVLPEVVTEADLGRRS